MVAISRLTASLATSACALLQLRAVAAIDTESDYFQYASHNPAAQANNQSMLWGPYKPNVYFGVRPRVPEGPWSSLMWSNVNGFDSIHKCEWACLASLQLFRYVEYDTIENVMC